MSSQKRNRNYLIRNQTPNSVVLQGAAGCWLALAPLQTRRVSQDPARVYPAAAEAAAQDQVVYWDTEPLRSTRLLWATWLAVIGFSVAIVGVVSFAFSANRAILLICFLIAAMCAIAGAYIIGCGRVSVHAEDPEEVSDDTGTGAANNSRTESVRSGKRGGRKASKPPMDRRKLITAGLVVVGVVTLAAGVVAALTVWRDELLVGEMGMAVATLCGIAIAYAVGMRHLGVVPSHESRPRFAPTPTRSASWELVRDFVIATSQGLVIVAIVVVAVAGPALAIYYGTELSDILKFASWDHPYLAHAGSEPLLVARILQLILLILVSLIPALMYFQFDREKLTTLVDRWLHAIFRLDPSLRTLSDVDAKYGRRLEEFYGATLTPGVTTVGKRWRDRSPVIVATLLIALGWIVVLLNNQHIGRTLPGIQTLFQPSRTPMTLAFLGGYFLAIQVALRGYVRGDLKPKTYNVITTRILMAIVLAWVLQTLWGTNDLTLGLSFLAGILPNTVLQRIREMIKQIGAPAADTGDQSTDAPAASSTDELLQKSPLWQLDDVDIYDRTRLEEEGITSIQGLARHDLIDLTLSSRIPMPRLIDWVDQALLYQHVPDAMPALKKLGIRCATDFLAVSDGQAKDAPALALNDNINSSRVTLLRAVLINDGWVRYLQHWRANDGSEPRPTIVYDVHGARSQLASPNDRSAAADDSTAKIDTMSAVLNGQPNGAPQVPSAPPQSDLSQR